MLSLWILLIGLILVRCEFNLSICQNSADGKDYLLQDLVTGRHAREIPDKFTVHELNLSTNANISCNLGRYNLGEPIPSLKMADNSPDEWMRTSVHKAKAMNPVNITLVHEEYGYFNPSIVKWKNRILMAYPVESSIKILWLEKGSVYDQSKDTFLGFGPDFHWIGHLDYHKEDPRLFAMANGSLLMAYTDIEKRIRYHYTQVVFSYNETTQQMENFTHFLGFNEKNWVPFEEIKGKQEAALHFIPNIHPWKVFRQFVNQKTGLLEHDNVTISHVTLPFSAYQSNEYRGSSPALMIKGVNLIFFHTRSMVTPYDNRRTYFMGVITFCPQSPFNMHSMSKYPILEPSWYDGRWMSSRHDYVVYPTGVVLSEDNKTLYLSSGYQDKLMRIFSFNVDELFESLAVIGQC